MNAQQPPKAAAPLAPFSELSDRLLVDNISIFFRELIRRSSEHIVDGDEIAVKHVVMPLPFSRSAAKNYTRIVELWIDYRAGTAVEAPSRPCPACRSEDSEFQFRSYDQYPYHACRRCGTWFVPQLIDGRVIDAFLATVSEARQISEAMMAGREELTRDSDRQRFGYYFEMLRPLVASRAQGLRYLDIGCGVGHSLELAAELGWEAHGVESNEVAVATARAKGRDVRLPGDGDTSGAYHAVSLFETLEHITDPDPVLAEAARLLAPNGVLIITVPNRASFEISVLRNRSFHVFGGSENVGHINLFDSRGIGSLLDRHGLSLMFTDGQFGSNLPQVFAQLVLSEQSVMDVIGKGELDFAMPELAYRMLNSMGPAFSSLERAVKRSPILIAIACRAADRPGLEGAFAMVEQARCEDLRRAIDSETCALLTHQANEKVSAAKLQQIATILQQQVDHRDELLEAARARFNRTVEGRVLAAAQRLWRIGRKFGLAPKE
jgi:SAM-dependent methyltransferase